MHLRLHRHDTESTDGPKDGLRLHDGCIYVTYPSFVVDFLDADRLVSNLRKSLAGYYRYWRGGAGGGVLELSHEGPQHKRWDPATHNINNRLCYVQRINGLECGNKLGEELAGSVVYGIPDFPPPIAVKFGVAKSSPKIPAVVVTAEHLDGLSSERFCLAVPKRTSKICKGVESVPEWFAAFGVGAQACPVSAVVKEKTSEWFDPPSRNLLCFRLNGGVENAAWQLAVTSYVATHWWTKWHGLEAMHFLAEIEGKPAFRSHWLNPMYR
jgi:hypothetical protein